MPTHPLAKNHLVECQGTVAAAIPFRQDFIDTVGANWVNNLLRGESLQNSNHTVFRFQVTSTLAQECLPPVVISTSQEPSRLAHGCLVWSGAQ